MDKDKLNNIIFWIIVLVAILTFFWYIFGNSPTFEQFLVVPIIGYLFKLSNAVVGIKHDLNNLKDDYKEFKNNTINSFAKIREEISGLKKK